MQQSNHTEVPQQTQDFISEWERARDQRHALEPCINTPFDANRSDALDRVIVREARLVSGIAAWGEHHG